MTIAIVGLDPINDQQGATAVEFAIIAPLFIALTVGLFNLCLLMFAISSMHFAVEGAARCASVNTTTCPNSSAIRAEAAARYYGPQVSQTFTYAVAACGNSVTSSGTFVLYAGIAQFTIPLSATACFP